MSEQWLSEVVVVNESDDIGIGGDVRVYRNGLEACAELEPWWVKDCEGFALTGLGQRVVFRTDEHRVAIERLQHDPEGLRRLETWLRQAAVAVLRARADLAQNGRAFLSDAETRGDVPGSIEGLIAYIGFEWPP